jgi:hypothetical protein
MNAGTPLSTYIPASQSTLDVCSHHPNLCIKTLRKSQPAPLLNTSLALQIPLYSPQPHSRQPKLRAFMR